AAPLSIFKRSRSIGFNHHTHGNLNQARSKMPLLCLFTTQRPRGVFVKTVCAFETFDSAAVERMRGPCHLFVAFGNLTRPHRGRLIWPHLRHKNPFPPAC